MVFSLLQARSRGNINITSADDIYAPPDFDSGLLSDPLDIPPQRWAYKCGREIQRRMPAFRGEWAPSHPIFPEGSMTAVMPYDPEQNTTELKDYVYSSEDDAAIDEWIRKESLSMWHPMGTCAMKARQDGGVVDKDLNVYGTSNLKIADMSITPTIVGANTASTALVIGEKAPR